MTVKTLLAASAALLTVSAAGATAADTPLLPGLWETKTRSVGDNDVETTRDCVTPAETGRDTLEKRLAEAVKDKSCKFAQRSVGGGKFAIAGTCNNGGFKGSFKQTGTYSPTAMTMNMSMTMTPPGAGPVSVDLITTSRRIAATCPAGEDGEE